MKFRIRIPGSGTFDFEGTEEEANAEAARRLGYETTYNVWRANLSRDSDRIMSEIAALWDADESAEHLFKQLFVAYDAEGKLS
jgi:hypothetical protein